PSAVSLTDLDAPLIGEFLDHLETERCNSPRTRNARLAAIHSFFDFIATREPAHSALIQQVLAIPSKRFDRNLVCFLTRPEIEALLASPNRSNWTGRRDDALFLLSIHPALQRSQLIGLLHDHLALGTGPRSP